MEPVAHTYIGMEIMSIIGYANNGFPKIALHKNYPVQKKEIMLPITIPISIHLATSSIKSKNP